MKPVRHCSAAALTILTRRRRPFPAKYVSACTGDKLPVHAGAMGTWTAAKLVNPVGAAVINRAFAMESKPLAQPSDLTCPRCIAMVDGALGREPKTMAKIRRHLKRLEVMWVALREPVWVNPPNY